MYIVHVLTVAHLQVLGKNAITNHGELILYFTIKYGVTSLVTDKPTNEGKFASTCALTVNYYITNSHAEVCYEVIVGASLSEAHSYMVYV